ncbi:helix-turn-helix domain-containing protein [Corynebacterium sp. H128]|uniref:helix-turn-helix transcriptional regulator n=1 Tax=Corynebacterium sp. H128 TaxID=3133427 RepID=UPI0030B72681
MNNVNQLQPAEEVAARLAVSRQTLRRWTKQGTFPDSIRIGRNSYYPPQTVEHYLEHALTG